MYGGRSVFPSAGVCLEGKLSSFSDISQNSILEKRTLHKIYYQKNEHFTKFISRKIDTSQNSLAEKQTLHKIRNMDTLQNSFAEKRTLNKIYYIGMKVSSIFWEFHSSKTFKLRCVVLCSLHIMVISSSHNFSSFGQLVFSCLNI